MFVTEKMCRATILLPQEEETRLWDRLGRFGNLEPGDLRRVEQLHDYISFSDTTESITKIREIGGFLGVDFEEPLQDGAIQPLEPEELNRWLGELESEVEEWRELLQQRRERERALERSLDRLRLQRRHLELLRPLKLDLAALKQLERFALLAGTIPRGNLGQLELSLRELPHAILPYEVERDRAHIIALALKEDEEQFLKILDSALFQAIELPELPGPPEEVLEALARREVEHQEKLAQLQEEEREFERWRLSTKQEIADLLKVGLLTLEALEGSGKTSATAVVAGWVPKGELRHLEEMASSEPNWVLLSDELSYEQARDEYGLEIPSKLRNPPFFRAFEALVNVYGAPRYGGFDPTMIFALLFTLIFGMMFGDAGQGLVLFLAGLWLRLRPPKRLARVRNTGTILAAVGASATVFGVLYGSFFGYENIIPALWFHPMEHINQLLIYAIIVGVGAIIIGILANIVSRLLQRRYLELVFERSGVLGLWFYLGALVVFYLSTQGGKLNLPLVFLLMFLPLMLMPLERPLARRLAQGHADHEEGEGGFTMLVTSAMDVFETILVYLSNSISFVRVAAFALNHIALSMAIFQLGGMMRQLPLGNAIYLVIVVLGNLIILVLEGGIVAIQTLRLEFYEFFSKFFREEGTEFKPFKFEFAPKEVGR